jgi:hypothetical protein
MLNASDLSGGLLEMKIASTMLRLESTKSYFALVEGPRHGTQERPNGEFVDTANRPMAVVSRADR